MLKLLSNKPGVIQKTGQRRTWEGTPLEREREQQQSRDVAGQHTDNDYDGPDVA